MADYQLPPSLLGNPIGGIGAFGQYGPNTREAIRQGVERMRNDEILPRSLKDPIASAYSGHGGMIGPYHRLTATDVADILATLYAQDTGERQAAEGAFNQRASRANLDASKMLHVPGFLNLLMEMEKTAAAQLPQDQQPFVHYPAETVRR